MTKKSFVAMLLYVLSGLFLIIGIILMCTQDTSGACFWLGVVSLFLFAAATVCASVIITPRRPRKERKPVDRKKLIKSLIIAAVSALLIGAGITLMVLVNWIAGYVCILLAAANLIFLVPVLKGFRQSEN